MSSYLLLRNNKESGPFTIEEMKGMSLKAYDLIWVTGKSAAWRYPGEIAELKPFAPPAPDQKTDFTKSKADQTDSVLPKKSDFINPRNRENNSQRLNSSRSVYVNLPAEKKISVPAPAMVLQDSAPSFSNSREPLYDFSDLYNKKHSRTIRYSGKVLWISTIILLFGSGILTGLFISDRRKFFTTDANLTQTGHLAPPVVSNVKKDKLSNQIPGNPQFDVNRADSLKSDSLRQPMNPFSKKQISVTGKKVAKIVDVKKDSSVIQSIFPSSFLSNDSLKQNTISKTEILYQKIKAHPENYVNIVTGRYSTGVFGGISSFPVSITNNSPVLMNLLVVNIDYIQNNEKVYKTESLSFNDLEPGETVTIKAPKSSRGIKIRSRIRIVNSRQLDLSYSN